MHLIKKSLAPFDFLRHDSSHCHICRIVIFVGKVLIYIILTLSELLFRDWLQMSGMLNAVGSVIPFVTFWYRLMRNK